jgi:hypothetical protein
MAPPKQAQTDLSHWDIVNIFTVDQASCLWAGIDPSTHHLSRSDFEDSQIKPIFQLISAAIQAGELHADSSKNPLAVVGEYPRSLVTRDDLKAFAESKKVQPVFLFDTLMPKGGRPLKYDWDAFTIEVIRTANSPDGLPESQAELIIKLLQWCEDNWGKQPADSSVKSRVSKIYNDLGMGQKPPK